MTAALRAEVEAIRTENAGVVECKVRRETGRIVTIYRSAEAGMDEEAGVVRALHVPRRVGAGRVRRLVPRCPLLTPHTPP